MQEQLEKTIEQLHEEVSQAKKRLVEAIRGKGREEVQDYELSTTEDGKVKLSELFGDSKELIVVHNMGQTCPYCTLWADGFNGVAGHLNRRAPFVVASPDDPYTQKHFAESRGWTFRMVSTKGTDFTKDMGFEPKPGAYWPGFTTFVKEDDGRIYKTASNFFGPGDDFCPTWHLFDLLEDGANGWEPDNSYSPTIARR